MVDDQKQISSSDELALDALSQASKSADDELTESNQLAETLTSLQN